MRTGAGKYTSFVEYSPHPFLLQRNRRLPVRGTILKLWVVSLSDIAIITIDDLILYLLFDTSLGVLLNLIFKRINVCVVQEIVAVGELTDISCFPFSASCLHSLE